MLRSMKELSGYELVALDGTAGTVEEVYFDDSDWTVRYLVIDTGKWLPGRLVLLSPAAVGRPDWEKKTIPVQLRKEKIEGSPVAGTAEPVSQRFERKLLDYYGWPHNRRWTDEEINDPDDTRAGRPPHSSLSGDAGLRSSREVIGYAIEAVDGEIGHVEDFIVDDESFGLRYVVVDTRNWLPGSRKVLVAISWVERVDWTARAVRIDLTKEQIEKSPEFDPAEPVNRRYEARLYDYYGRPR